MKYWRNGKVANSIRWWALFSYIWVVPAPSVAFTLFVLTSPKGSYERSQVISSPKINWDAVILAYEGLLLLGVVAWLITVLIRLTPAFKIKNNNLLVSTFGWSSTYPMDCVHLIKVYNLGPIGTMLDLKSEIGTCFRQTLLVTKVKKETLRTYLEDYGIRVE